MISVPVVGMFQNVISVPPPSLTLQRGRGFQEQEGGSGRGDQVRAGGGSTLAADALQQQSKDSWYTKIRPCYHTPRRTLKSRNARSRCRSSCTSAIILVNSSVVVIDFDAVFFLKLSVPRRTAVRTWRSRDKPPLLPVVRGTGLLSPVTHALRLRWLEIPSCVIVPRCSPPRKSVVERV